MSAMHRFPVTLAIVISLAVGAGLGRSTTLRGDDPPNSNLVGALEELLLGPANALEPNAKRLLDAQKYESLYRKLQSAHHDSAGASSIDLNRVSSSQGQFRFGFKDRDVVVSYQFTTDKPYRIHALDSQVIELKPIKSVPLRWDNVDAEIEQAVEDGFSGAVLLTRNGKIVLNQGYGLANREQNVRANERTIFAIGSAPIDFTHAGILLLVDRGKLKLEDPITKYFDGVPKDKQPITIKHLMTGQSGLPDFHERPADQNPDHSWIDRDEAIRRIMSQKLLFAPGQGRRHSHSAWGWLAATIERVSGQSYQEFTTEHLFQPAKMFDTGFFGDDVPVDRIAVGYGMRSSTPNSPPHWGPTSWLVMGSGGQVSTLSDMYRWEVAMRNGSILSDESAAIYLRSANGVSQDGDSFGFEFMHSKDPNQLFMIISNSVKTRQDRRKFDQLGRRLHQLIKSTH